MTERDAFAGGPMSGLRAPVRGLCAMVVSGHSAASLAGLSAMDAGGSVVDALIATSAALCAAIPHATSLGGDGFVLLHDAASGRTTGLNASGTGPAGATLERFAQGIPVHGGAAATVPGIVAAWRSLHQRHGRLPWDRLFGAAIDVARAHPTSRLLAAGARTHAQALAADPGCAAVYMRGTRPPEEGRRLEQPALAATLEAIAAGGADAFYRGDIARSIASAVQARGGCMQAEDLADFEPEWVTPLSTRYRGLDVSVMPPNSYGVLMLMQLAALEGLPSASLGGPDPERLLLLIRAARAAFAEGQGSIADPHHLARPAGSFLADEAVARLRAALHGPPVPARAHAAGGTSCITVMDGEGNGACVVQSVFHPFGAACLDPATGVLLSNRMTGFSLDPDSPNVVAPGKRPAHTLNPVLVCENGTLRHAIATPGGPSQTLTLVQVLVNLLDRGMDPAAAIGAPRWGQEMSGKALLEKGLPAGTAAALADAGVRAEPVDGGLYFGSVKHISRADDGVLTGFADHRREAFAVGV